MWSIILMVILLVAAGPAFSGPADSIVTAKPSRYGPHRTTDAQTAKKGSSPFEQYLKAQASPGKSSDCRKDRVLVKVTPAFQALSAEKQ